MSFTDAEIQMIVDRLMRAKGITPCYCCGGMILDSGAVRRSPGVEFNNQGYKTLNMRP